MASLTSIVEQSTAYDQGGSKTGRGHVCVVDNEIDLYV